jgi:hypothetical protein
MACGEHNERGSIRLCPIGTEQANPERVSETPAGTERRAAGSRCHGLVRWSERHPELSAPTPPCYCSLCPSGWWSISIFAIGRSATLCWPIDSSEECARWASQSWQDANVVLHVSTSRLGETSSGATEQSYSELDGLAGGGMRPRSPPTPATGMRASRPAPAAQPLLVVRVDATEGKNTRVVWVASMQCQIRASWHRS